MTVPRLKEYRGNPEHKRYAAFERFDGGLNTTSVDEAVYENEFRELVNAELIEEGMVQNRKGFGSSALLNNLLAEDVYFDADADFIMMKVVKDTHNLLYRMRQYSSIADFDIAMTGINYELDILFVRHMDGTPVDTVDITLCEIAPSGGNISYTLTELLELTVLSLSYKNITGLPTVDFEDEVYISLNMINSLLSGFAVYNTTDKTLIRVDETQNYYVPSPYEVSNVGFNVLAENPFEISAEATSLVSVRNLFLTSTDADPVMLRKVPQNEEFYLNIIYTGTTSGFLIDIYEEDGFGEKQPLEHTATLVESPTGYPSGVMRYLIKGNFTNKPGVFIKVYQTEEEEMAFAQAFDTTDDMLEKFVGTNRRSVLVKTSSLYAAGYSPDVAGYYGHVLAEVPGCASKGVDAKSALDIPVYVPGATYPSHKNGAYHIIVPATVYVGPGQTKPLRVYVADFDEDGKVVVPGVYLDNVFRTLDAPTGDQIDEFDAYVTTVITERPNLYENYKIGGVEFSVFAESDEAEYASAVSTVTVPGVYLDETAADEKLASSYDPDAYNAGTGFRLALIDTSEQASFSNFMAGGTSPIEYWVTDILALPASVDGALRVDFTADNLTSGEFYGLTLRFYDASPALIGEVTVKTTENYAYFDYTGLASYEDITQVRLYFSIEDSEGNARLGDESDLPVPTADLIADPVPTSGYVYRIVEIAATDTTYYAFKDLATYAGTLADFEEVEADFTDTVSFINLYTVGEDENRDPVEPISTKGVGMLVYQNRLMLYGGNTIVLSDPFKFNYFPNYNYIVLPLDSDDSIQKIAYYRGSYMIFTKERIYRMSGTYGADDFKLTLVNDSIGCIAPNSVRSVNNTLLFLAQDGLYLLKQSYYMEGLENVEKVDKHIKNVIPYGTNHETVLYNEQYWLIIKDLNHDYVRTVKQYYNMEYTKYRFPYVTDVYSVVPDNLFKIGTDIYSIKNGIFYVYDSGYTDFGTVYDYTIVTPNYMLGYPEHDKKFKNLYLKTRALAKHPIYITIYIDDNEVISPYTYRTTMTADGFLYEAVLTRSTTTGGTAFVVDGTEDSTITTDKSGITYDAETTGSSLEDDEKFTYGIDRLGGQEIVVHKVVVGGKGKSIRMKIQQSSDKSFGLQSIGVLHKLGKARETR